MSVLITGATGYLGRRLTAHYLEHTDEELVLLVRRPDQRVAESPRVTYTVGDLDGDAPLDGVDPSGITAIVHAAALTKFNVEPAAAQRSNVDGTARVLDFARTCRGLQSLGCLSTVYATGLRGGPIREELAEPDGFANAYERSKSAAEQLVAATDLPWRILRVATVIADDESGRVWQYNAVHDSLKLWFYGLLSLLPGNATTPLYLVTGDFVTTAVHALMVADPSLDRQVYAVCHDRSESLALGEFLDVAETTFAEDDGFRRKRILRPLLADFESFSLLVDGLSPVSGNVVTSALRDVAPFARQLYVAKDVDNSRLRAALPSYAAPDARALVAATCRDLVRTRWGRHAG